MSPISARRAGEGGHEFPLSSCPDFRNFAGRGKTLDGAIAQLGERYNGIVEVTGSIPVGSTNKTKDLDDAV